MDLSNLRKNKELGIFILDFFMLFLVIVNLIWILFDSLFASMTIQELLNRYVHDFYVFYRDEVHPDFPVYDMYFVGIFILELLVRWANAIRLQRYHRWFFYPFIHWYDVLGCIPIGSLRTLRVLRIVSIMYRLQRNKVIDLTKTYIFQQLNKYYKILVEELSDRVVLNVLEGIQSEVKKGIPVTEKIMTDVLKPQKAVIVEWASNRVQKVTADSYGDYREQIQAYVDELINEAVNNNQEIKNIAMIPIVGKEISRNLENAIADIVFNVINNMVQDLASSQNKVILDEVSDILFDSLLFKEENKQLNDIFVDVVYRSIEVIKDEVKVQQWKIREAEEQEIKRRAKNIKRLARQRR